MACGWARAYLAEKLHRPVARLSAPRSFDYALTWHVQLREPTQVPFDLNGHPGFVRKESDSGYLG
jgi:hypothetical protein